MAEEEIFSVVLDARMAAFEKQMLQAANKTDQNLNRIEKKLAHTNSRMRRGLEFRGFDARSAAAFKDVERRLTGLRGMALGGLGTLGLSVGIGELVKSLREDEEAARRLDAVLRSTGHAAGMSQREIAAWADELERRTGRGAAEIQTVAAQLATFTSIGRNEFLKAIEVADDLAATFGGDLQSNLDAVARALDDPIKGFGNLQKRGFALADAELKRVKAHLAAGESAKAQGIILENLSKQVSGAAEATNQGLTKELNRLKKQAEDTFKAFADQGGTDAAIKAVTSAGAAMELAAENAGTLLSAAQALAAFIATRYAVSMGIATVEVLNQAAAAVKAKGSIEALSAAMAKNAAGIAALAVAALVFALVELDRRVKEAVRESVRLEQSQIALKAATDAYAVAAGEAASATGKDAKAKREAAQRTRDAAVASRDLAASKLAEAQATLAALAAANLERIAWENAPGGSRGDAAGTRPRNARQISDLQIAIEERQKLVDDARAAIADADRVLKSTGTTGIEFEAKPDKSAAKAAEQRKRLLEDLKASTALEVAQLDEQVAKVRELERQAEITARIRQLEDAGFSKARARSESAKVQSQLDKARAVAMEREQGILVRSHELDVARLDESWDTVRAIEAEVEKRELIAALSKTMANQANAEEVAAKMLLTIQSARVDAAKRGLDLAREEHRLAVAQLSGNRQLTKELQDQAAIRERTKAYQAEGYGLKPDEVKQRATAEVTRERTAANYGEQRELFASAFSDGIRAAMAGDLQGFLSNQFGNFADTMMQRAGEQIFDSIFGGVDAVAEGASQGAAMAATVTPAITGAGSIVATEWASAITSAGAIAGASIASAIAGANVTKFAMLPGFSEGGYTGPGGVNQPAGVAHKGEVVWSQKDVARAGGVATVEAMRRGVPGYAKGGVVGRTVIPGVNAAMNRMSGASHAQQQPVIIKMAVEEGALFQPTIEAVSGRVSVQTTAMGVATVQDQQRTANMRRRQSLVG